jgi:hypothetical protein
LSIALLTLGLHVLSVLGANVYAQSPYESGYDHGCDDAKISGPYDRYINQPGKGPENHTPRFMNGYDDGYDSCKGKDGGNDTKDVFKIIVKITNDQNSRNDLDTDLHVRIYNDHGISQSINDIELPHPGTKTYTFEFDSDDVPVGTDYKVYFKFGGKTYTRHGENSPSNSPEKINFNVHIK